MQHRIIIFNQEPLNDVDGEILRKKLLNANLETLCEQYQLDPALIAPAITNLDVIVSKGLESPYFLVPYGAHDGNPIIVYEWDLTAVVNRIDKEFLLRWEENKEITTHLLQSRYGVEIELTPTQLKDMGLLFAYEIARWAAAVGKGVILGLDAVWYRLNRHLAFIPITTNDVQVD